jgi:hypothetical protein
VYFGGRDIPTFRGTLIAQHITHKRSCPGATLHGVTSQQTVIISNGFEYHSAGRPTSYATLPTDGKLFSCLSAVPPHTRLDSQCVVFVQLTILSLFHSMPRDMKSEHTCVTQSPFYRVPGQGTVVRWKACNRRASPDSCNVQGHHKKIHHVQ